MYNCSKNVQWKILTFFSHFCYLIQPKEKFSANFIENWKSSIKMPYSHSSTRISAFQYFLIHFIFIIFIFLLSTYAYSQQLLCYFSILKCLQLTICDLIFSTRQTATNRLKIANAVYCQEICSLIAHIRIRIWLYECTVLAVCMQYVHTYESG